MHRIYLLHRTRSNFCVFTFAPMAEKTSKQWLEAHRKIYHHETFKFRKSNCTWNNPLLHLAIFRHSTNTITIRWIDFNSSLSFFVRLFYWWHVVWWIDLKRSNEWSLNMRQNCLFMSVANKIIDFVVVECVPFHICI